jgi:hypothetical protein
MSYIKNAEFYAGCKNITYLSNKMHQKNYWRRKMLKKFLFEAFLGENILKKTEKHKENIMEYCDM